MKSDFFLVVPIVLPTKKNKTQTFNKQQDKHVKRSPQGTPQYSI